LDASLVRTSLAMADTGSFKWMADMASDFMNWAPGQPQKSVDKCSGVKKGYLESAPCDQPLNFACEAPKPEYTDFNLSKQNNSF